MTDVVIAVTTRKDDNHVVVQKRLLTEPGLEWSFPSGKIEPNETPAQAAIRELQQETGLVAEPIAEIGRRQHPRDPSMTLFYIHCEYRSVSPRYVNPTNIPMSGRRTATIYRAYSVNSIRHLFVIS